MKTKVICLAVVAILAAVNLHFVFISNGSGVNFSLANIMALARGEYYGECSVCGEDVLTCNCEIGITCDYGDCHGSVCHRDTGNWLCPCYATGNPFTFCLL